MARDYFVLAKRANGTRPLTTNKFSFKLLSQLVNGMFSTQTVGKGTKGVVKAIYDFSVHGGAIGTINLLPGDDLIPDNAIITNVIIDVVTAPTSLGSATVAFGSASAGDILGTTAIAALPIGLDDGVPDNTATNAVKLSADTNLSIVIGTAALTAGYIVVFAEFVISE